MKVIILVERNRRLDFRWLVDTGGMPSSHSAFATALATAVGLEFGFGSGLFAVAVAFAVVVMADAAGLRRAAGKQAEILNQIVNEIYTEGRVHQERLKEFLGHTPVEVFVGALLGVLMALASLTWWL